MQLESVSAAWSANASPNSKVAFDWPGATTSNNPPEEARLALLTNSRYAGKVFVLCIRVPLATPFLRATSGKLEIKSIR